MNKKKCRMALALLVSIALSACGTTGNTSHFALPLDISTKPKHASEVHVASIAMDPDAATLINVNVQPWGKFSPDDLKNIEDSLRYTLKPYIPTTPSDSKVDVHILVQRYVVGTSNTGGAVLACVAWAATTSTGDILYEEQFYASGYGYLVGTIGLLKDSVDRVIVRRIAVTSLELALHPGARPPPAKFPQTSTSLEEAAAQLPSTMVSMGNASMAAFPNHAVSTVGLLTPNGIQTIEWHVAAPSQEFDWQGYLRNIYK